MTIFRSTTSRAATIARPTPDAPLLSVEDLVVTYRSEGRQMAVRGVSFSIARGEAYGLVGESGCGKSTIALAIMRYLSTNGRVASGRITFAGEDVLALSPKALQELRGNGIAMVYQDPGTALNPAMTVGEQVAEVFTTHQGMNEQQGLAAAIEMLNSVRMPGAADVAQRYPHQLSGGMQQRVVIAMALAANPSLLILDEPTTGLDATVEAAVLDLIRDIREERDVAILMISHNLAVVSQVCDRVGVLYAGEMVEEGPASELFPSPQHPYTGGLLSCVPRFGMTKGEHPLVPIPGRMPRPGEQLPGCLFAPRCPLARERCVEEHPPLYDTAPSRQARCHFWPEAEAMYADTLQPLEISGNGSSDKAALARDTVLSVRGAEVRFGRGGRIRAVNGVSFDVGTPEIFGLVGESGSGKSTIARAVAGLLGLDDGTVVLDGKDISGEVEQRAKTDVKRVQMVFQSPEATLNPRQTVRQTLARTVRALTDRRGEALHEWVRELGRLVQLDDELLDSYPSGLSGGQRQRVAIARAFAGDPDVVLCDEPVSNLDVSVQATILTLLADVQRQRAVAYIFISHDLGVIRYLSDRVGVMYLGSLVEIGDVQQVFAPPFHPYTETLFAAMPTFNGERETIRAQGSMPSAASIPSGCPFHTRCPRFLGKKCETEVPPMRETTGGHAYQCWIPPEELTAMQTPLWEERIKLPAATSTPTDPTDL